MQNPAAEEIVAQFAALREHLGRILLGKAEAIELALATLVAGGHLLIEDLPGVGKTTLAAGIARGIGGSFQRVQFTADLLPSDVIGTRIFRRSREEFDFVPGPVFANVLLADELNRAPPKTQSALLQAMNEGAVTVDRETRPLPEPFMVLATQNPRGHQGTYPLPESQRDRFLVRLAIGFPDPDTEVAILEQRRQSEPLTGLAPVVTPAAVCQAQAAVRAVEVPPPVAAYMVRLAEATRQHPDVVVPVSPRGTISLMRVAQAVAWLRRRRFVDPDLIKQVAPSAIAHRLGLRLLAGDGHGEGAGVAWVERELLARVPIE